MDLKIAEPVPDPVPQCPQGDALSACIFDLLQKFPDFTRQYAGELEKELGLEQIP